MRKKDFVKHTLWYKTLQNYEHIMIFGTKDIALKTLNPVSLCGKDVECFVVSDEHRAGKPDTLLGKPLKAFCDIPESLKRDSLITRCEFCEHRKSPANADYERAKNMTRFCERLCRSVRYKSA